MAHKLKVGIIGCGTMGTTLAAAIAARFQSRYHLEAVCDHHPERLEALARRIRKPVRRASIAEIIRSCDLIVETATPEVARRLIGPCLKKKKILLAMSVGGLLGMNRAAVAAIRQGRILIPSGAIGGLDALAAAREAKIESAKLITRKPPQGLEDAPYFRSRKFPVLKGSQERCVFRGTAAQAVRAFPQNINVAAVLSLASLGPDKTRVEIWTSQKYRRNEHELQVTGNFGSIRCVTSNVPSPENPKTSYLAILSALAVLRNLDAPVRLGT